MKSLRWSLLLLVVFVPGAGLAAGHPADSAKSTYNLVRQFEVAGRQGVAADEHYYYVSGSKSLYKYSKDGQLLATNATPFEGYPIAANHIGDIDVFEGEIFVGAEWFVDGRGKDIQIAIHDAETLKFKRTFAFDPTSGQHEVSGITVDRKHRTVWLASWVGGESGRYLYEYDLRSGKYTRKMRMDPAPKWIQGVFHFAGEIYVTADDGDADKGVFDHLYRVPMMGDARGKVVLERTFHDVRRAGEIEGLGVDPTTGELLVHFNRGRRIVLGMPRGFYPGYDREIHEVYVYRMDALVSP